jgi:Outer membrane protein (porin)
LNGNQEIADGLSAVFNLQTGFNPQSGKLSDGLGSIVQNNGLAIGQQNSFADSAKDGQAFNVAAYAGLSSPIYGTLTYGRQNALTSDGVVNYDPMSNSGAFSLIGFQGATGGAGDTENRIFDNSFKYAVNVGPFRAAAAAGFHNDACAAGLLRPKGSRLIPAGRRLSVRNSARSELEVSVKPPTRLPAWTFIKQVYGGGSLGPTAVVIANLGKSRTSVAEFPANYCHIELLGGERRCCHIGRYAHCENCECQNGSHCSLC